jgi:hypothetical protein
MLGEMETSTSKSLRIGEKQLKTKKMFMLGLTLDSLRQVCCKGQVLKLKLNNFKKLRELSRATGQ